MRMISTKLLQCSSGVRASVFDSGLLGTPAGVRGSGGVTGPAPPRFALATQLLSSALRGGVSWGAKVGLFPLANMSVMT
jgi:hypothetical protein